MRKLLGNNCSKGCLIYMLALIAVVAITSMGLGGLGARFGAEAQNARISPLNVPGSQQANPVVQAQSISTSTNAAANTQANAQPTQAAQPAQPAQPPMQAQAAPTPTTVPFTFPAQSGTISGEASQPFYIVQAGDTLWDIAQDYGITVETLKTANSAIDEIIKPGELVHLPQGGQVQTQPQQAPAQQPAQPAQPAPATNQQPDGSLPTMPQTGITKKP